MRDEELEQRLKDTFFVVEATNFEQHCLWGQFANNSPHRYYPEVCLKWEQVSPGFMETIGHIGDMPVCMSLFWVRIDGKLVMFWELTSRVCDYNMAEEWLKKHFNGKYDNGTRRAETNASNFHHCIHAIRDANKEGK